MPSPRCSNFSTRRLLLKEPLPLPPSSPFGLCDYSSIYKITCSYISFWLIVWILKLHPPGVSPPTADMTASAAQRHGVSVDAWKCPEKVCLLFIHYLFVKLLLCRVWDWQYVWLEEQDEMIMLTLAVRPRCCGWFQVLSIKILFIWTAYVRAIAFQTCLKRFRYFRSTCWIKSHVCVGFPYGFFVVHWHWHIHLFVHLLSGFFLNSRNVSMSSSQHPKTAVETE